MSRRATPWGTRKIYEFIATHRKSYDVRTTCNALDVTRSGCYVWLQNRTSRRAQQDARLLRLIRASGKASHGVYGSPRVFLDLREAGETCSKHRVARLMRVNTIRALHGYRTRHYSAGRPAAIAPTS
jgi:putative transposase